MTGFHNYARFPVQPEDPAEIGKRVLTEAIEEFEKNLDWFDGDETDALHEAFGKLRKTFES